MIAFNGNQELKNELLKKLKHHQELDAFIQGKWLSKEKVEGNGYKGCFYGCTMQTKTRPILKFSEKYGVDIWYCYLTENIFENLPSGEYKKFPLQSIEILPTGFDINKIKSPFFYALLEDQLQYCQHDKVVTELLKKCRDLFKVDLELIDKSEAESISEEAASIASSMEFSPGCSLGWSSKRSAESVRSVARSVVLAESVSLSSAKLASLASESAAQSATRSASRLVVSKHYVFQRDLLFSLIKKQ